MSIRASALTNITRTDSYKGSHFLQYPPESTAVSSYIEPRGGEFDQIVFFGLQAFIKDKLMTPITKGDVIYGADLFVPHGLPYNKDGWMEIVNKYGGYLPLQISALTEGTVHGIGVPQVQIVNRGGESMRWLTSYQETQTLRGVWYPSTVASLSRRAKEFINVALEQSADDPAAELPFKLHDFGARGASSAESAAIGGMGHLVNFMGTDTVEAVVAARLFYGEEMAGFSIPATEHSTMTSWTRSREADAYANMLEQNPEGLVAIVSDSYDIFNAVSNIYGGELKAKIEGRNGTLVVRPDSGNPTTMAIEVMERLGEKFGTTQNSKGYKVLPDCLRVIQGDGMSINTIPQLLQNMMDNGWSASNIAMGMGGGLLQKVDRDTCKYATKANAIEVGGEWVDVFKDPITDQGKRSKRGRQAVVMMNGQLEARRVNEMPQGAHGPARNYLQPVYDTGELLVDDTFAQIRERASL